MRGLESKILSRSEISELAKRLRSEGKRIVSTNGCFDLLHWGHLKYLAEARALGDVLVVGLNSDTSVKGLKGSNRPLFPEKVRARQLAALESVDYVVIFSEATPEGFLRELKPSIHVKGGDYAGKDLPEKDVVEKNGGKLSLVSLEPGYSTTELIARLKGLADTK